MGNKRTANDDRVAKVLHCLRCEWAWIQMGDNPPMKCPRCQSALWNTPRVHNRKQKYQAKQNRRIVDLSGIDFNDVYCGAPADLPGLFKQDGPHTSREAAEKMLADSISSGDKESENYARIMLAEPEKLDEIDAEIRAEQDKIARARFGIGEWEDWEREAWEAKKAWYQSLSEDMLEKVVRLEAKQLEDAIEAANGK